MSGAGHFDAERAGRYDEQIRTFIPGYETLHALAAALLRPHADGGGRVLVVGAGTGMELITLGARYPEPRFTAVDPSAEMMAVARERVGSAGLAERVTLRVGRVDELPADPPHDAATVLLVMHFLPDDGAKLDLLRETARRLAPGARLVLADLHGAPGTAAFAELLDGWRSYLLQLGADPELVESALERVVEDVYFVPEARILSLLEDAGFGEATRFFGAGLFGGWVARRQG